MSRKYKKRRSILEDFTCENCSKVLPHTRSDRVMRFCGRACYQASRNKPKPKICPQCKKIFTPERHYKGEPRIHCSRQCDHKARVTKQPHICKICGGKFLRVRSQNPLYCSRKCLGKAFEKNVIKVCEWCKKEFTCKPSVSINRRFCSRDCIRAVRGESRPERLVREALEDLQIPFIREYKIRRYRIDFFLPNNNLAVEADGTFWHANPVGKLRDERRDTFVLSQGIKTIRITEADLNKAFNPTDLVYSCLLPHLSPT